MKKEVKKYLITERVTEATIKNIGGNRWLRRKWKSWTLLAVLCFAWTLLTTAILKANILNNMVAVSPFIIGFIAWAYQFSKEGTKFWNQVKNNPEPIDLG